MKNKIIPFNENELFINVYIKNVINQLLSLKNNELSDSIDNLSNLINIKSYIKNDEVLEIIENEIKLTEQEIYSYINRFVSNWFTNNIEKIYFKHPYIIQNAIWYELNVNNKFLSKVSDLKLDVALKEKSINIDTLLQYENITKTFNDIIFANLILDNPRVVNLLLKKYELERRTNDKNVYLPSDLNPETRYGQTKINNIIEKFIKDAKYEDVHKYNTLRSISISKYLRISKELKFLANKKYEDYSEKYFNGRKGISYSFGVSISDRIDYKDFDAKENTILLSEKWLKENDEFKIRFIYNCSTYLGLLRKGRFNIDSAVSKHSSILDLIHTRNKSEYYSSDFSLNKEINNLQLIVYNSFLEKNNSNLEELINEFYNTYVVEEFEIEPFGIDVSRTYLNFREKSVLLLPDLDLILQKISYYLNYKKMNFEFIDFDDDLLDYRTIKSGLNIKNIYLGSEQSPFIYLNYNTNFISYGDDYISLYDAVSTSELSYTKLNDHDKNLVDSFIDIKCLFINNDDIVLFVDNIRAYIYHELYYHEELVFYHFGEKVREVIQEDINKKLLKFDSYFLSKRESDWFSYLMDKRTYSNSLNLRNRFIHKGNIKHDKDEFENLKNYYHILLLLVQITLKFNIELCLINDMNKL